VKEKHGIPEAPVSMVEFPQGKNIQNHRTKLFHKRIVGFLPPVRELINGAPFVEFPVEMDGSIDTFHDANDCRHHKEKDATIKQRKTNAPWIFPDPDPFAAVLGDL
jgi:hypothetical protein